MDHSRISSGPLNVGLRDASLRVGNVTVICGFANGVKSRSMNPQNTPASPMRQRERRERCPPSLFAVLTAWMGNVIDAPTMEFASVNAEQ